MNKVIFAGFACILSLFYHSPSLSVPTLKVYSFSAMTSKYGAGPELKKGFERLYDCKIEWVPVDTMMMLLNRLKWEGEKTKADIVLGIDSLLTQEALALNLFVTLDEPPTFGQSNLIPYSRTSVAFIYDENRVHTPPHSFDDLMSGRYKILLQDPRTSGTGTALVAWIRHLYKDEAPVVWKKLQPHILTFTRGWSEAYTMFQRGEGDLVLSYLSSPLYHEVMEGKTNFRSCPFEEGNFALYEMVGIIKTSKHQEWGKKFIAFLLSDEGQHIVSTKGWQYPLKGKPPEWDNLVTYEDPNTDALDPRTLDRVAWVDEWLEVLTK